MLKSINDLSELELDKFDKFLVSPFFNSRDKIISLFGYLKNRYPNITTVDIDKKNIFRYLYPDEKYNDIKIRRLISDFIELYENFLVNTELNNIDPDYSKTILLETLQNRGIYSRYDRNYKELTKKLKNKFDKDDSYYKNLARIEIINSFHSYNINNETELERNLQNSSNNLDLYFVFSKLHIFREMLIRQKFSGKKFNFRMKYFNEVTDHVKNNQEDIKKHHPNIYIIYLTIMAMVDNDESKLNELIRYIHLHRNKFSNERLNYYYNYVISELWMKLNAGNIKYKKTIFELYDEMIVNNFFRIEKYLSHIWVNNAVNIAVMNGRYVWVTNFLNKHKNDIEPAHAEAAYNLSLARLYFSKNEFITSLKYLQKLEFKDPYYYIHSKHLQCRVLYETGDLEQINFIIDTLKHYSARNKKLIEIQISSIKMIVKYFNWLMKIRLKLPEDVINMKRSLDKEQTYIPAKEWFYEKLDELYKNKLVIQ